MNWPLLILITILASIPARAEELRNEIVWVGVNISPKGEIRCPSVASHVPPAFANAAIEAVSGRSYADVLKTKLSRETLPARNSKSAAQQAKSPRAALRWISFLDSIAGMVAVRFEEVEAQPGHHEITGMQLIGETDPTVTVYDVTYEAVLDASGAVVSATPEGDPPAALERVARAALDQAGFEEIRSDGAARDTQVTVTLLLSKAESDSVDVAVGPIGIGPRLLEAFAPKYPKRQMRKGTSGWAIVTYDTDADGVVVNADVVCAEPEGVFDEASLRAAEKFRYSPERVNGIAVPSKGLRNLFTFVVEQD